MLALVVVALVGSCQAAPQLLAVKPYINSGSAAGPLTAAFGDLVSTNRGLRPISLEGFSEDINQDGFVDPIGQAVAPVVAAPVVYTAPAVAAVAAPAVEAKAVPAATVPLTYTAAAAPLIAAAPTVYHTVHAIPQVTVQRQILTHTTHQVINHAPIIGAYTGLPLLSGLPVVAAAPAAAAPAAAEETVAEAAAPAVEQA